MKTSFLISTEDRSKGTKTELSQGDARGHGGRLCFIELVKI